MDRRGDVRANGRRERARFGPQPLGEFCAEARVQAGEARGGRVAVEAQQPARGGSSHVCHDDNTRMRSMTDMPCGVHANSAPAAAFMTSSC